MCSSDLLYLVRDNELIETKGDRRIIGQIDDKESIPYVNNEVQLKKGDSIYIFSDGYADQFGGEKGKKFMSRRFKKLFLDMQDLNMEQQKERLDKTIEEWRTNTGTPGGEIDQVDDILVVGLKV